MAAELKEYYGQLEEKVREKSRELVRSERLASVGFLAAGVAHEINNPLGIIATYAELSLAALKQNNGEPAVADARRSLEIIHQEAFRCKDITQKLLSLSKSGEQRREPVNLADVARDVAEIVGRLRKYADRQLVVAIDDLQQPVVFGSDAEMKQVLLNLVVNALDAVRPGSGRVEIGARCVDDQVELSVTDNGCGMNPATLERVFEPFFSSRRESNAGVGLGLSICHAIVETHGGRVRADSEGPGQGSRFTVALPLHRRTPVTAPETVHG
jgi:signal transduction histidine kinase